MTLRSDELAELAELLDEALDLPGGERESWLERLSGARARLSPVLRRLLERHAAESDPEKPLGGDRRPGILETLPKFDDPAPPANSSEWREGTIVGPYQLIRELGQGGMSAVWLATRTDGQLNRAVALKLPFGALNRGRFSRRFDRERDILAGLTHPRIARLYDAGVAADGQPFLAMEFVKGTPLLEYCDRRKLDLKTRLALFEQVLSAVQYAHSRLVVHRDLKPSNILVTEQADVVLLDFGIAKLMSDGVAHETELTLLGGRAMTPDYASPEQILGEALGTTSDIYSLGVILYELLTGTRPYRLKRNSRGALEDAILDLDPALPSRMCTPESASLRGASTRHLASALRGDLDTIILKALGKKPESRYPTADALAQDVQRYLRGEPIQAQAAKPWYRARKFLARNKLAVSLAGALLIALVGGLGIALWEAQAARSEARRAEHIKQFLVGVFAQSDPQNARGKDITAGELLESGAARLDQELRDDPRMLGELHQAISDIYMSLGANVDGLSHAERSIVLLEKAGRQRSTEYIRAISLRAEALQEEEKWGESIAAHEALRRAARDALGPQTEWEAIGLRGLAWAATEQGRLNEAKGLYAQALRVAARVAGEKSIVYVKTLGSSIQADLDLGLLDEAQAAASKAIALQSQLPAYTVTDQLVNRYYLAVILYRKRRYAESVAELDRLVPDMDSHIGVRHDRTIKARALLAQQLAELGDFTQALAQERINIESVASSRTGDPEMAALQDLTFAKILRGADRFDEGVTRARTGLAYFDAKYSAPTALRERGRWVLGDLLLGSGDVDAGLGALAVALQNIQTMSGSQQSPVLADAFLSLGNAYRLKGDPAAAARNFDAACGIYDGVLGRESQSALRCRLYQTLVPTGSDPAPGVRKSCDGVETLQRQLRAVSTPRHPLLAEAQIIESDCLVRLGRSTEAAQLRDTAVRAYREAIGAPPRLPLRILH